MCKAARSLTTSGTLPLPPRWWAPYRARAPRAAVRRVYDLVEVGQPLCIIEAMKLMNEIESEVRGRVVKILVENAEPVEYGQPLFVLEKE